MWANILTRNSVTAKICSVEDIILFSIRITSTDLLLTTLSITLTIMADYSHLSDCSVGLELEEDVNALVGEPREENMIENEEEVFDPNENSMHEEEELNEMCHICNSTVPNADLVFCDCHGRHVRGLSHWVCVKTVGCNFNLVTCHICEQALSIGQTTFCDCSTVTADVLAHWDCVSQRGCTN